MPGTRVNPKLSECFGITRLVLSSKDGEGWDFSGGPVAKTPCSSWSKGSIPGQATRSHMPQLRAGTAKEIDKQILKKKKTGAISSPEGLRE